MWLKTPEKIEKVLWEASLEPEIDDALGSKTSSADIGIRYRQDELKNNMPIVSIGMPETWNIIDVFSPEKIPTLIKIKLSEADFYLVRFSCSFRFIANGKVEWAQFLVQLCSGTAGQPLAFDLYPTMVAQEIKHDIKVTLGPTLNFEEIEAEIGSIDFGLEYKELQPVISATGVGEEKPMWDYKEAKGMNIQGSKFMYMIIKVPKGMRPVEALLDLVAVVRIRDYVLPVVLGKKEVVSKSLTVRLVG